MFTKEKKKPIEAVRTKKEKRCKIRKKRSKPESEVDKMLRMRQKCNQMKERIEKKFVFKKKKKTMNIIENKIVLRRNNTM